MSCEGLPRAARVAPPRLDARDRRALLAELVARLPGFAATMRPREGEAGWALLSAYARYLEILGEGLNALPERTLLAFLDLYGESLGPAQSSRVPLVFTLLPTAPGDVELPERSTVAAKQPSPSTSRGASGSNDPAPLFHTTQSVTLTRASLKALYSIDPSSDCYTDCSAAPPGAFVAFEDHTPVAHQLYLGHDQLFALTGTAEIVLSVSLAECARPERLLVVVWEYLSLDGWLALQVVSDATARFTQDGDITLSKCCGPDAKQDSVNGRTTYWIRASVTLAQPFADIAATRSRTLEFDTAPNWTHGDVMKVEKVARGVVDSVDGKVVKLEEPEHFDAGEIVTVTAKATCKVVNAPVIDVQVGFEYPFLAGDAVTIDGENTATVIRAVAGTLEFEAPLAGAQPGTRLFLDATPPPLRPEGMDDLGPLPRIDTVFARVGLSKRDLQASGACLDTAPLDLGNWFYPFGKLPDSFATFCVASGGVFALPGAQARLEFTLARVVTTDGAPVVSWEYFDGTSWQTLGIVQGLVDATQSLTQSGIVTFVSPGDWAACEVNGVQDYWLRARLESGDYGHPLQLKVSTDGSGATVITTDPDTLAPPVVAKLRLGYTWFSPFRPPDACVTYNDFHYADHAADVRGYRSAFAPFEPVDDRSPSLHFGFSEKLPEGLVGLYVEMDGSTGEAPNTSPYKWEYLSANGWVPLSVLDGTNGFKASGMIQWVGAPDAAAAEGLGGALYWIRASLKPDETLEPANIEALWMNAVWALQGEQVQQLVLGESDGNPGQGMPFPADRVPILPGETIEVREWTGRGEDWRTAVQDVAPEALRFERDAVAGTPLAVWVRWNLRDQLFDADANERAYLLERATGLLRFGDGVRGMIPPAGARIAASFATGGGIVGNVPAGAVTELRTGIAYLQGVSNPLSATGGAQAETIRAIEVRGPQGFRNRDRSVAFEDYEWLAREASPDVARVRCLPVTGPDGKPQRGWVSLLIAPQSSEKQPQPSPELARRVIEFLSQHGPATVSAHLSIAAPRYVAVGVRATLVPRAPGDSARIEQAARDALDRFLHPLAGGPDGDGWQFGQSVYLSQVAALLGAIEGVDCCPDVRLTMDAATAGDRVPVSDSALPASGAHDIKIELAVPVGRALAGVD